MSVFCIFIAQTAKFWHYNPEVESEIDVDVRSAILFNVVNIAIMNSEMLGIACFLLHKKPNIGC